MKTMLCAILSLSVLIPCLASAAEQEKGLDLLRTKAEHIMQQGNYKEAYEIFEPIILSGDVDPLKVGRDLQHAVRCLQNLNRRNETDDLRERAVAAHPGNWRLLWSAAQSYFDAAHYGYLVAGEFHRGHHRGGGRYVNSFERDRVRALQLMTQALPAARADKSASEAADFMQSFAGMLMGYRGRHEAWRLQILTDLSELPDVEDGYRHGHGGAPRGAPVDPDGKPVFYAVPDDYEAAASDGERWRWLLQEAARLNPKLEPATALEYASFLHQQFGVQTIASYPGFRPLLEGGDQSAEGRYLVHTLDTNETIARLATGVQRFDLPEAHNYIAAYRAVADRNKDDHARQALEALAQIYENRRQYETAVDTWRETIKRFGPGHDASRERRLEQITDNWGRFEPVMTHPAGRGAQVDYRFRNGRSVHFTARTIDIEKLLADVNSMLKGNPQEIDWRDIDVDNIGYRLVQDNQTRYLAGTAVEWSLDLQPADGHWDRRITIDTPLREAGAYLLTARMEKGNESNIIIWITDTVLARKNLQDGVLYFVADAVTGRPLPDMNVEFFGYRQERNRNKNGRRYDIHTANFALLTDADGLVVPKQDDLVPNHRWLVMARSEEGRLAFLGFSNVWYGRRHDQDYHAVKALMISDRPVYRPNQTVHYKFWVRHAQYDKQDTSQFAHTPFVIRIHDARNEKVHEATLKTDEFGGLAGDFALPDDCTLGQWRVSLIAPSYKDPANGRVYKDRHIGSGSFRVEEYKKPEFEVAIEAPKEPVMLGEKIEAVVRADYYFGAPVTKATVSYKVLRTPVDQAWYPPAPWDWFYGRGYWWFAYDYTWYPGWEQWGCERPVGWWWPTRRDPPEVVAEAEVPIGADGTVRIPIDTALALELHGDQDHRYEITAEVTDQSRRTIVGKGQVLVARQPFKVHVWVDRGYYRVGDTITANMNARTLDGTPVQGKGTLRLLQIAYRDGKPEETEVQSWSLATGEDGSAAQQLQASRPGQYRLAYEVTDQAGHTIEGGYVFVIRGEGFDGRDFRFNAIELVPDKAEYRPGEAVRLMINTEQADSTVVLFVRPTNGIYLPPEVIRLSGKSAVREIAVSLRDMPNFFVEAFTISDGRLHGTTREIVVPPEKRVMNVDVRPSQKEYKPGQEAVVDIRLTDLNGKPFVGSTVLSVYDRAVEYISGGSNVPDIREFFWKWRRRHHPRTESNLDRRFVNRVEPKQTQMQDIGVFGAMAADDEAFGIGVGKRGGAGANRLQLRRASANGFAMVEAAPVAMAAKAAGPMMDKAAESERQLAAEAPGAPGGAGGAAEVEPTVRTEFADTAFWAAAITTDADGKASVSFDMPENLTGWIMRAWAMGHGTVVGQGRAEAVTRKELLLRMQAPRFFVETDTVVLSANIHNDLPDAKDVRAVLELDGPCLEPLDDVSRRITIDAHGEARVDWRVKVVREGEAIVRMKALTDTVSDAMQMSFPVYVHGMLKTESFCGMIRPDGNTGRILIDVPAERRIDQSRLEIRYSPTLAGAMIDALPYLAEYPYGCTEQTLNRFVPTVIVQKILTDMDIDLAAVREKAANLNAQEIGDPQKRAEGWKRWDRNPVYDEQTVHDMVVKGLKRLTAMQLGDGGWGWFSGSGEHSSPHTTATVVHGLQVAQENGAALVPGVLEAGVQWLKQYQEREIRKLQNAEKKIKPWKARADNTDALVYRVLVDAGHDDEAMREFLYRDRLDLSVYANGLIGLAYHRAGHTAKRDMVLRNIEQYLVEDDENQTAYLKLPNSNYWWFWYGSEFEAHAVYLKLLAAVDPHSERAAGLVKYLLNNRKHATYWNSTRDTALCIEAMADYLRASGEAAPDMTLEILVDGAKKKEVRITAETLLTYDDRLVLTGTALTAGRHEIEIRRRGKGPVYFNAYLTNFTLQDFITSAGLEIKVHRDVYKLVREDATAAVAGARGQAIEQRVEKVRREKLDNRDTLKSGDLVEVELVIESKNDYEYLVFEDMKAAGFEPVELRSGYVGRDLPAYMELRDEKAAFFVRRLARGKHSVSYRLRAEIPGSFSALPARGYAMYAPELKANSDEIKLSIED